MKVVWLTTTGVCITVAAVLMWRGDLSAAFVVAVLGMVAWALNYRMQVKESLAATDEQRDREIEEQDEADHQ
ncbi:MAG: hypothetical protein ABJB97_01930 [Acidobacteriota bacterium]